MDEAMDQFRRTYVAMSLAAHNGNVTKTARALGVSRRTIHLCMSKYGLDVNGIRLGAPWPLETLTKEPDRKQ